MQIMLSVAVQYGSIGETAQTLYLVLIIQSTCSLCCCLLACLSQVMCMPSV
jgi:hypothetical protein